MTQSKAPRISACNISRNEKKLLPKNKIYFHYWLGHLWCVNKRTKRKKQKGTKSIWHFLFFSIPFHFIQQAQTVSISTTKMWVYPVPMGKTHIKNGNREWIRCSLEMTHAINKKRVLLSSVTTLFLSQFRSSIRRCVRSSENRTVT